jgi:hypothetical protein
MHDLRASYIPCLQGPLRKVSIHHKSTLLLEKHRGIAFISILSSRLMSVVATPSPLEER